MARTSCWRHSNPHSISATPLWRKWMTPSSATPSKLGVDAAIGLGLLRLHNWARRLAILSALLGMVLLLPSVSSAVLDFRIEKLVWKGLGVMVRAMIVWYLYQHPVKEAFDH